MMTENANWFSIFLRGMHNFTRHWKGNQSLLSISPLTSTASLILYRHVTVDQIAQKVFSVETLSVEQLTVLLTTLPPAQPAPTFVKRILRTLKSLRSMLLVTLPPLMLVALVTSVLLDSVLSGMSLLTSPKQAEVTSLQSCKI